MTTRILIIAAATLLIPGGGPAQSLSSGEAAEAGEEMDTSGTNPAQLSRTFQFSNEYRWLEDSRDYNVTDFRFTQPFLDGSAAIRLTVPLNASNLAGDDAFGLAGIAAKFSYIPHADKRQAFILSTEVYAPTASEDILGTGKWVVAPGITWAYFASPEIILAPAYIRNWSFAGGDRRPDVNRGDFDFYVVYRPLGKRWWITSDIWKPDCRW